MYKRQIYDIPGFPMVTGQALVDNLLEQIKPFGPTFHLNQMIEAVEPTGTTEAPRFRVTTDAGTVFDTKTVIIAAGGGSFQPKKPPIPGIEAYAVSYTHLDVYKRQALRLNPASPARHASASP